MKTLRLLAIAGALFLAHTATAQTLVRHCEQVSGTSCNRAVWVQPQNASVVVVLRGTTSPWVPLAEVLSTERITVCIDDPAIVAGQPGTCATRIPGRTDNWQLKSIVYPTTAPSTDGTITVTWDMPTVGTDGQPFSGVAGYRVRRQQDVCSQTTPDPRCGTMPWVEEDVGNVLRRVFTVGSGRWCFTVQGYIASGEGGGVSQLDPERACALPGQVIRLPAAPPNVRATSGDTP
jgi:hypothetical protein